MLGQAEHGDPVPLDGLDGNQMGGVRAGGEAEHRAPGMGCAPGRGDRGPGGVAEGAIQVFRDLGVRCVRRILPGRHLFGETRLGEGLDAGLEQFAAQCRAVDGGGVGIFLHRLALHEQALASMDGIERVGAGNERADFGLDAEQGGDEGVQMAAEGDNDFPFGLGVQGFRRRAGGKQARVQLAIRLGQVSEKQPVQADQPVSGGQIGETQAESQGRGVSFASRIRGSHRHRSSSALGVLSGCAE